MQSLPNGYRALILGATGALGTAFADQLRADPRCSKLVTLGRSTTPAIDFENPSSIAQAAQALQDQGPWHLILVTTGMLHGTTGGPEKRLADLRAGDVDGPRHRGEARGQGEGHQVRGRGGVGGGNGGFVGVSRQR